MIILYYTAYNIANLDQNTIFTAKTVNFNVFKGELASIGVEMPDAPDISIEKTPDSPAPETVADKNPNS